MRRCQNPLVKMVCLTVCCMLLFSGCLAGAQKPLNAELVFTEEKTSLPDSLYNYLYLGRQEDGSLLLVGYAYDGAGDIDLCAWALAENTLDWVQTGLDWVAACVNLGAYINAIDLYEGTPYSVTYSLGETYLHRLSHDQTESFPLENNNGTPKALKILSDIHAVVAYNFTLEIVDFTTGSVVQSTKTESELYTGFMDTRGPALLTGGKTSLQYYAGSEEQPTQVGIEEYSVETPHRGSDHRKALGQTAVVFSDTGDAFYFANTTGVYKTGTGGNVQQITAPGNYSFAMPVQNIQQILFTDESTFYTLLWGDDEEIAVYRYTKAESPIITESTLRIYSLHDSPTARLAAMEFGRRHPEIAVEYEVGYDGVGGLTENDAIQLLNARMLANNGPDVLILDGLPYESYLNNGLLTDLEPLLDAAYQESLYWNLADPLPEVTGTHIIATRFSMPMLFSDLDITDAAKTLEGLIGKLLEEPVPLINLSIEYFMHELYNMYFTDWFEDGVLKRDTFENDLRALRALAEIYSSYNVQYVPNPPLSMTLPIWTSGAFRFVIGELTSHEDLVSAYSVERNGAKGELFPLWQAGGIVYYPRVMVGITTNTENREGAAGYLNCILSDTVQKANLRDGFSVSRPVQHAQRVYKIEDWPVEETSIGVGGGAYTNPFTKEHYFETFYDYWPDTAYFEEIEKLWEQASITVIVEEDLKAIFTGETMGYLAGEKNLEETMENLNSRITLYWAEKETSAK